MTGKVTVAGKGPLTGGTIQFVLASDDKILGGGQVNPDGTYMVPDAPVGECKVVIDNQHLRAGGKVTGPIVPGKTLTRAPTATKKMNTAPKDLDTTIPDASPGIPKYMRMDASYYLAESTPITFTVPSGEGTKDFDVK